MQKALHSLAFVFALPHGDPFVGDSKINPTAPQLPKFAPN